MHRARWCLPTIVLFYWWLLIIITYKTIFKEKSNRQDQLKSDCNLRNNDIALLEEEIACLKCTGFHSVAITDVELGSAAMDTQSEVIDRRRRITYLKNEKTLASLKQKVEDDGDDSAEIAHLQNEIWRLNREIANYLEDELLKSLGSDCNDAQYDIHDKVAHTRYKIYHIHVEIVEHLQRKIFDIWGEPKNHSQIFRLRKEMSVSLVKVFACFADYPNDVELLYKDIGDMDEHIVDLLTDVSDREEFTDDIKHGEEVALKNGEISYRKRKIEGTHAGKIDLLRIEVVNTSKVRLERLKRTLQSQQDSAVISDLKSHIDTLQAEIVRVEERRLAYKQEDIRRRPDPSCEYNKTIDSLKKDIIALNEARIEYRERKIEHIKEEHTRLDCELSPGFSMQIDSLRKKIISLKTQVLCIHESDMIPNYVPLQLYIWKLKDDIGDFIDDRIAYQNKVFESSHVDQQYDIKLEIETLKRTKSRIMQRDGMFPPPPF